ncbi:Oidioi.mRNA.OKI2018_I69.chr2.g5800.t1.cds [Oikopleura dioica]|uniref:Oidioi.mRNA.OKI2018_I69.chr2.g5800.t1.cds n=1 Tax=Oikopleura dioica TaxID=34765 RepID=A0ABN7T7Z5_OIKDI|nr:Oidioi.mRNA.OKI2018_I69.chr2.g5800.t1.cds [Oikopleura dioica]
MPKSESVKRESIPIVPVDIFGHTHRPLLVEETALMDKNNKKSPIKRKTANADDPVPFEALPVDLKIQQIIYHLLIQGYELFPYFLYKAVWDDDFDPIQWGDHMHGETIVVNFHMLFQLAQGCRVAGKEVGRAPEYVDNYGPGDDMNNRLQHNLVNIFGFNDIGVGNVEDERNLNQIYQTNQAFFWKLDQLCEKYNLDSFSSWHEFHHADFFKNDNPKIEDRHRPKRKNSKFFKICQTLKTDYRVRKQGLETSGWAVEQARPYRGRQIKAEHKPNPYRTEQSGSMMMPMDVVPIAYG